MNKIIKNKKAFWLGLIFLILFILLIGFFPATQTLNSYLSQNGYSNEITTNLLSWQHSVIGRLIITWSEVIVLFVFISFFLYATELLEIIKNPTTSSSIENLKENNQDVTPWFKNKELWLIVFLLLLFLPRLGSGGLWDPWETHYGEVSRRMVERNDWISTWWENEWFFSKPILIFWVEALSISLFGFDVAPDQVSRYIEWGIRFPMAFFSIFAIWVNFRTIRKIWDEKIALWCSVILATMPQYFFITHQGMTDMLFVSPMIIGLDLLMLASLTDDEEKVSWSEIKLGNRVIKINSKSYLIAALIVWGLPQYIYIATRPLWFESGSLGQNNIRTEMPLMMIPGWAHALVWFVPWLLVLLSVVKEQRLRRIYLLGFFLLAGIATLGKAYAGIVLPGLVALAYITITGEWWQLKKGELLRGIVIFFTISTPWYIAMLFRHGNRFFDRLFIQDQVNRLAVGVHGDTGTIGYFIQQLAYGTYPWGLLVPGALLWWWITSKENISLKDNQHKSIIFIFVWFAIVFSLFTAMITKFHHYILPAVPPLAILSGIFIGKYSEVKKQWSGIVVLVMGVIIVAIVSRDLSWIPVSGTKGFERLIHLYVYNYQRAWPQPVKYNYGRELLIFGSCFILISLSTLWWRIKKYAFYVYTIGAVVFAVWALDVYMVQLSPHWSQRNLFNRYYELRQSPQEPIIAYQMGWRGEPFFTGNKTLKGDKDNDLENRFKQNVGKRVFVITQVGRSERVKTIANKVVSGAGNKTKTINPEICNKFNLILVDLRNSQ